uniref:(northern house mosquito) hypothetical protein n=1 Tax=Culex pipiens TaxID=7175 RepID=A0A8D8C2G2_CULPI
MGLDSLSSTLVGQAGEEFALTDAFQVQVTVVIFTSGNILGIFAVSGSVSVSDLEHGSDRASVLAGHSLQADVVLTAVLGVGMSRERSGVGDFSGSGAGKSVGYLLVSALRHLVSPHADARFTVVGQSGGALVARGFAVPTVPEHVAFGTVREDTVQTLAVWSGDWWF